MSEIFAPGLLDGRAVLVTGGGTGLGRAATAELRACGAEVVICGRRLEVLERTAGELGGHGVAGGARGRGGAPPAPPRPPGSRPTPSGSCASRSSAVGGSTRSSTTPAASTSLPP